MNRQWNHPGCIVWFGFALDLKPICKQPTREMSQGIFKRQGRLLMIMSAFVEMMEKEIEEIYQLKKREICMQTMLHEGRGVRHETKSDDAPGRGTRE